MPGVSENWYDVFTRRALASVFGMPSHKLPNYIRSHRKCCGLSQNDVAFILSSGDGAKISRYEHFKQQPNLETALALEILFRTPTRTLFRGASERIERRLIRQIQKLSRKLEQRDPDPATLGKIQMLETLCCELRQMRSQST